MLIMHFHEDKSEKSILQTISHHSKNWCLHLWTRTKRDELQGEKSKRFYCSLISQMSTYLRQGPNLPGTISFSTRKVFRELFIFVKI